MMQFIEKTVKAEMTTFYKKWVTCNKREDYNSIETYFKKYGNAGQFENSKFYKQYKAWENSDQYVKDLTTVKNLWIEDCVIGFNSRCEEIIDMEDDDDVRQTYVDYLQVYSSLSNKHEKIEFLCNLYAKQDYYPLFSYSWLYDTFDERITLYE
jgi:hypothetical protein